MSRDWLELCGRQTLGIDRDKPKVVTLSEITQTPKGKYRVVCLQKVPVLVVQTESGVVAFHGLRGQSGIFLNYFSFIWGVEGGVCVTAFVQRGQRTFFQSLFFHQVDLSNQTQVLWHGSDFRYPLGHLTSAGDVFSGSFPLGRWNSLGDGWIHNSVGAFISRNCVFTTILC